MGWCGGRGDGGKVEVAGGMGVQFLVIPLPAVRRGVPGSGTRNLEELLP